MKILYLHQYFNTPEMPGGTRSYEMARRLVQWGHEVNMITTDRQALKGPLWRESEEAGIRVHWTPIPYSNKMSYRERMNAFGAYAFRAGKKAIEIGGDVVFATSTPLTVAIPAVKTKKALDIPMVFEVRDLWPEVPIAIGAIKNRSLIYAARRLEQYAYQNASKIIALSPGMKEGVVRAGYPVSQVVVIPNSCDMDLFDIPLECGQSIRNRHAWLGSRPLVSYIGTFGRVNGVSYLVRLAVEVKKINPEIRFVAIGDGKEWFEVRKLAQKTGVLGENFFMFEGVPKKEIPLWFSATTVSTSLVIDIPEMWNNSANKFFDALASGKPIAINHYGWQADILAINHNGLVLDPKDIRKAASALVGKIESLEWLTEAGKASSKIARNHFERDLLAKELLDALAGVVAENSCSKDHRQ